jgi:hypothetical protein
MWPGVRPMMSQRTEPMQRISVVAMPGFLRYRRGDGKAKGLPSAGRWAKGPAYFTGGVRARGGDIPAGPPVGRKSRMAPLRHETGKDHLHGTA